MRSTSFHLLERHHRAQACERAADSFTSGRFVDRAGIRDLAVAQIGDVAEYQRFALARLELGERVAQLARALASGERIARLARGRHELEQLAPAPPRLEHV